MRMQPPRGIGRVSIPALIALHITAIISGGTVGVFLGAVVAAFFQVKDQDNSFSIMGVSLVAGAILPSLLLWRARARSLGEKSFQPEMQNFDFCVDISPGRAPPRQAAPFATTPNHTAAGEMLAGMAASIQHPRSGQVKRVEPAFAASPTAYSPDRATLDEDPFADEEEIDEHPPGFALGVSRIRDWQQLIAVPVQLLTVALVLPVLVVAVIGGGFIAASSMVFFMAAIPVSIIVTVMGIVFDGASSTLTYPVYVIRRSIPLDAIRAANCQNVTHRTDSDSYSRLVGEGGRRVAYTRSYHVNLSGSFESRRLKFASKYKRDQFLTYLRDYVPACRITRWS